MLDSVEGRALHHHGDQAAGADGGRPSAQPGPDAGATAPRAACGAARLGGDRGGSPSVYDDVYAEAVEGLRLAAAGSGGIDRRGEDGGDACNGRSEGGGEPERVDRRRRVAANGSRPRVDADEVDSLADDEDDGPSANGAEPGRGGGNFERDARSVDDMLDDGMGARDSAYDNLATVAATEAIGDAERRQRVSATKAARGRGRGMGKPRRGRGRNARDSSRTSAPLRRGRSKPS
jgi:hypothetical protein